MKKLKWLLMPAILILSLLAVASATGILEIDLNQALEMARFADSDGYFAEKNLDDLAEKLSDVVEEAEDINVRSGTAATRLQKKIDKNITPMRAELDLEIAKRNEDERQIQLEYDVNDAYEQVYLMELDVAIAEKQLEIADLQHQASQIKLENGQISGTAYLNDKHNFQNQELTLMKAKQDYQKAIFSLNELMGQPIAAEIQLAGKITTTIPTDWQLNIDAVYEEALQNDESVYRLGKEVEFAELKLMYAGEEFSEDKDEYRDVEIEKQKAIINWQDAKNSLYQRIASDGYNILSSLENYDLQKQRLVIAKQELQEAEIRYRAESISGVALWQAELKVMESEKALIMTAMSVNNSFDQFELNYLFLADVKEN